MKKIKSIQFVVLLTFSFLFHSVKAQNSTRKNIESAMVKALEWQEAHPIYAVAPTDWTNGAYYTGVTRAHQATNNQTFLAALKTMGYANQWKPFDRFYHADDIAISYAYLHVNTTRRALVDLEPTATFIQKHLSESHVWKEGNIASENMQILWWWCDALFMAPPVLAKYAKLKKDERYLDEMHKFYMETYNLLYDKEEHLFARDLRFVWKDKATDKKGENGKKIFWSRGNGWVLGGLALILEDLPKNYKHRAFYEKLFIEMASKIKELQPNDGLWRTSLLSPESYKHGETSGSGFFTFALAWGINNGLLSKKEYKSVALKAWKVLETCQHDNGMIGWVQNIGFDPRPADVDSWQNYGTGAFLLAGSEILKLK